MAICLQASERDLKYCLEKSLRFPAARSHLSLFSSKTEQPAGTTFPVLENSWVQQNLQAKMQKIELLLIFLFIQKTDTLDPVITSLMSAQN